jgi:hypothetical protein
VLLLPLTQLQWLFALRRPSLRLRLVLLQLLLWLRRPSRPPYSALRLLRAS